MKNIDRLLKKKGWTGAELGKLLIASMLNDIKTGGDPARALFSQKDFENMEKTLTTDRDFMEYGVYTSLYHGLTDAYNRGQGLYQQFYNGFTRLMTEATECFNADNALKALNNTPLIMTESQYNRLEAEARAELEAFKESFCSILFQCLDYFLEHEEEAPDAIKKALEATKSVDAKKSVFLQYYNRFYGEGYYQLPDGARSDKLTSEEWQKAIQEYYLKTHELIVNGEKAGYWETLTDFNQSRLLTLYELLFKGSDNLKDFYREKTGEELPEEETEELLDALEELANGTHTDNKYLSKLLPYLDHDNNGEWHYYEEAPEGLSLYDLLDLYTEAYRGYFNHIDASLDEKTAHKLLKKDAPELYKALKSFIEATVAKAKGLKANQLYKDIVSWGELAKLHFLNYEELTEPDTEGIIDAFLKDEDTTRSKSYYYRASFKGIAVIKKPHSSQVDANGDYIEEDSPLHFFQSLYSLEEDEVKQAEILDYGNKLFKPALRFMYAYNALLGIIGKEYDLPDLQEVAQIDISLFESNIAGYNGYIYIFYHEAYGSKEERDRKRAIIKECFPIVDVETLKPTQEAIDAVDAELRELGVSSKASKKLRPLDAFIDRLTRREGVE